MTSMMIAATKFKPSLITIEAMVGVAALIALDENTVADCAGVAAAAWVANKNGVNTFQPVTSSAAFCGPEENASNGHALPDGQIDQVERVAPPNSFRMNS